MERIGFVLHGKIRGKKAAKQALAAAFSTDYEIRFYETSRPKHAEELTVTALKEGCDYLVSVGGDGTLNEMVNGFIKSGGRSAFPTRLGVLPYGTGNDFARGIGMNADAGQLAALVRDNRFRNLDAGSMELQKKDGTRHTRYFDNIADLGIGAEVVARVNGVHLRKKILGGTLTFFLSALWTFLTFKHKRIRVEWEGFRWEGRVLSLVVANGIFFGSGLGIAPEAKLDDGKFEVIILADLTVIDYLKNYMKVRRSEKIDHPQVFYHRAAELKVETEGGVVTIAEADGEIAGQAPIVYRCLPGALPFLVP